MKEIKDVKTFERILNQDKPVLLDFYADWCGPCQALLPTVEKLAEKYENDFIIRKVNVDTNPALAQQFKVRSIPALFVLKDKKVQISLHISDSEIYAGVYREGIYFSSDEGKNWVPINFNLPELRVGAIIKTREGIFAGTDSGIFQLKKGQTKWELLSEMIQVTSFSREGETIIATNKGVLLSDNQGLNWHWFTKKERFIIQQS